MSKPSYRDLAVIIVLSLASLAFLSVPALNQTPLNLAPQILIFLLLPGYALIAVISPQFGQNTLFKRAVLSFIVSLLLTIVTLLIPVETPPFQILVFLTVVLSILALLRRGIFPGRPSVKSKAGKDVKEDKSATKTHVNGFPHDLLLVMVLTLLSSLFILVPFLNETIVRTLLGLSLVLFLPGYALIASLFPKRDDLDTIERLALSFGLSIAITPLIGLVLNYTPFGIRLDPILICLTCFTLILSATAYLRRNRLPEEERFSVDFGAFFTNVKNSFQGESRNEKVLSVILALSIIIAIITTAYIILTPKESENFTEFYILGPGGKASDYPTNLTPGQEGNVIIGIINHENKKTSYRLFVTSNGTVMKEQTVTLANGEKIEIPFSFTASELGEMKIEFLLFKLPDNDNIYRSLHLWLNITGSLNETPQ